MKEKCENCIRGGKGTMRGQVWCDKHQKMVEGKSSCSVYGRTYEEVDKKSFIEKYKSLGITMKDLNDYLAKEKI